VLHGVTHTYTQMIHPCIHTHSLSTAHVAWVK